MPRPLLILEMVILTLLSLIDLLVIGIVASGRLHGRLQWKDMSRLPQPYFLSRLPQPYFLRFFCFAFAGSLLSTVASYLRYFRGSQQPVSLADICSLTGLLALAIAFLTIRKPLKDFVAANGGTIWSAVEASRPIVVERFTRRWRG